MRPVGPNPSGLCMCGCSRTTKRSPRNDARFGMVKGEHTRYLPGHVKRTMLKPSTVRERRSRLDPPAPRRWYSGFCAGCGEPFTTRSHNARYCTARCLQRDKSARRRVREAAGPVDDVLRRDIYERDQWVCQLCGDPVDRGESWPHPDAPSLDHITPVVLGGGHEWTNLQLTHLRCNLAKGAQMGHALAA